MASPRRGSKRRVRLPASASPERTISDRGADGLVFRLSPFGRPVDDLGRIVRHAQQAIAVADDEVARFDHHPVDRDGHIDLAEPVLPTAAVFSYLAAISRAFSRAQRDQRSVGPAERRVVECSCPCQSSSRFLGHADAPSTRRCAPDVSYRALSRARSHGRARASAVPVRRQPSSDHPFGRRCRFFCFHERDAALGARIAQQGTIAANFN
jgi:hypothetical protein